MKDSPLGNILCSFLHRWPEVSLVVRGQVGMEKTYDELIFRPSKIELTRTDSIDSDLERHKSSRHHPSHMLLYPLVIYMNMGKGRRTSSLGLSVGEFAA